MQVETVHAKTVPVETFGIRFRAMRKAIIDPETGRPMNRDRMAARLGVSVETVRNYERDKTLPLQSIRRELIRTFPELFSHL